MNEERLVEVLTELRDELRLARAERNKPHGRRWYQREPFKALLSHGVTVCFAVGAAWGLSRCTGQPVSIDLAAEAPAIEAPAATTLPIMAEPLPSPVASVALSFAPPPMPPPGAKAAKAAPPAPPAPAAPAEATPPQGIQQE